MYARRPEGQARGDLTSTPAIVTSKEEEWIEGEEWVYEPSMEELDRDFIQPREEHSTQVGAWPSGVRARPRRPEVSALEQCARAQEWLLEAIAGRDGSRKEKGGVEWEQKVHSSCLDPDEFEAGLPAKRREACAELIRRIEALGLPGSEGLSKRRDVKLVLGILEKGYKPDMRSLAKASERPEEEGPGFQKKLSLVEKMLEQAVGAKRAAELLQGEGPAFVHFGNRASVYEHGPFVKDAIEDMIKSGAVKPWSELYKEHPLVGREPLVISPLGVVSREVDGKIKRRLVLDIRYPNIFMRNQPFKFEKLRQIFDFLKKDGWICVSDFKSGYHHVPMHPSAYQYMAFEFEGVRFAFVVMPFGLKPAVYVFDTMMRVVYRCTRLLGFQLCFYIDDRFSAYTCREEARWREEMMRRLFTLLGWFFALDKGQLEPKKWGPYLGFLIDSARERIEVSERKIAELIRLIEAALAGGATAREYARIAGKLLSMQAAIGLAPLFVMELYHVVQMCESWEEQGRPTEVLREDLRFLQANLARMNGNRWFPPPVGVRLKGDASEFGVGAHTYTLPGEELQIGPLPDMAWALQPEEVKAELSSTLREAMALKKTVLYLLEDADRRESIKDYQLIYVSDNQGLVAGCNRMFSRVPEIAACYREAWRACSAAGVHLKLEWEPRELNQKADELSKVLDPSAFGLPWQEYKRVCQALGVVPVYDAFADELNTKCTRFCSLFACSVHAWVDAFCCGEKLRLEPGTERRAIVWAFPPPDAIGRVLKWIEKHQLNVVLVYPVRPDKPWWPKLQKGGGEALPVIAEVEVSTHGLVRGARVPREIGAGWPRALLRAALIQFEAQ